MLDVSLCEYRPLPPLVPTERLEGTDHGQCDKKQTLAEPNLVIIVTVREGETQQYLR